MLRKRNWTHWGWWLLGSR